MPSFIHSIEGINTFQPSMLLITSLGQKCIEVRDYDYIGDLGLLKYGNM